MTCSGSHGDKIDEKHMFFEQVCVLIASWSPHFAPYLLKAVVTPRESRKAALVSTGLVEGPRGSQLVPKPEGFVLGSCSIPGKLGFAAMSLGWEVAAPPWQCSCSCFEESFRARNA